MDSDIKENEEIQRIFENAGCKCLIDLYEKMQPIVSKHGNPLDTNLMLNYLESHGGSTSNSLAAGALLKAFS